jgi:UDP-glucuronate 4-epimerase
MGYLVTGAAGFIGFHTARMLLQRGERVIGLDNLSDYYSVALKRARLAQLEAYPGFTFRLCDLADRGRFEQSLRGERIRNVIHLAAQPGVRYSLDHPHAYAQANLVAHLNVLEYCRHCDGLDAVTYASSSSVYGGNTKLPFSESDRVDAPVSLYAATKKSGELMAHAYAHLFRLPLTGLRFFTVYGPWGRPDMAVWLFTQAILAGEPIKVFNAGNMRRDFTYIDDIVAGVLAATDAPAAAGGDGVPHRIYNIGNNRSEELLHLIAVIERALGRTARKQLLPMQPGDVPETYADIDAIRRDHGFAPTTTIEAGVPQFIAWYKEYHGLA